MGSRSAASSLAGDVLAKDDDFDIQSSDSSDDDEAEVPTSCSSPAAAEASKLYLRRLIELRGLSIQDLEDPRLLSVLQEKSEIVIRTWIQRLLIEHGFLNEFEDIDAEHNLEQCDEDTDSEDDNGSDQLEEEWLDLRDRIECGDLATLQELNEEAEEEERELALRSP